MAHVTPFALKEPGKRDSQARRNSSSARQQECRPMTLVVIHITTILNGH